MLGRLRAMKWAPIKGNQLHFVHWNVDIILGPVQNPQIKILKPSRNVNETCSFSLLMTQDIVHILWLAVILGNQKTITGYWNGETLLCYSTSSENWAQLPIVMIEETSGKS